MTTNVEGPPTLTITQPASRLSQPGLDIIVVHGITTLSLPPLPSNWSQNLATKVPENSRILSYDVNFQIAENSQWELFELRTLGFMEAINLEYQREPETKDRILCYIGYGLAGIIVKKTLYELTQQSDSQQCVQNTRGLIFLATPHITDALPESARKLAGIFRYEKHRGSKVSDLQSFATCCQRFTEIELALRCSILSCWERVEMKVKSRYGFMSHTVQRVDKQLSEIPLSTNNAKYFAIDCKLDLLFTSTDYEIHDVIGGFMASILRESNKGNALPHQNLRRSVDLRHDTPTSLVQARMRTFTSSEGLQPSSPISSGHVPTQSGESISPPRTMLTPPLMSPSPSPQNTPRNVSLRSSERSYVFISGPSDLRVPDSVTYVQNQFYEKPNNCFQGREDMLSRMTTILSPTRLSGDSKLPKTCVLCGPAGMGKTQAALQYFHSCKSAFDVVLWVQANNVESLLHAYYQAAVKLGLQSVKNPNQQPDYSPKQVVDWLRKPFQEPANFKSRLMNWLVVFDNVNDEKVLTDFWPLDAIGSVIITTRDPLIIESRASFDGGIVVDHLSPSEAVNLLRRRLPERLWHGEQEDTLIHVVETLDRWPLAIVQMAGKMQRLGQTPSRFLINYRNQLKRHIYYDEAERVSDGYVLSLSSLWSLDDLKPAVARLLMVLSLLLPVSIPAFVLEDARNKAQLDGYPSMDDYDFAISQLEKDSTITRVESSAVPEVSIHSFIQEVVRSQLLKDELRYVDVFNATVRLLMAFWDYQSIPTTKYRELALAEKPRWERCNMLMPHMGHVRSMFELLSENGKRNCATEQFFYMMNEVGWHHVLQRSLDEALDWAQATLEIFKLCPNSFPLLRANQYATLSAVARERNQSKLARENYEECFQINQEVYNANKVITSQLVAAYTELGRVMIMDGKVDEAEKLINESTRLRKKMPHFSKLQLYSPTIFFSYIEVLRGRFDDAEKHLLEALKDRELEYRMKDDTKSKRPGHLLYTLGQTVSKAGRFEEGYGYYHRAHLVFQETGGDFDLDLAQTYYKIARWFLRDRSYASARTLIDRAITTFSRHKYFQADHSRALFLKSVILNQSGELEDVEEAKQAHLDSINFRRQVVPNDPRLPETLTEDDFDELIVLWHK